MAFNIEFIRFIHKEIKPINDLPFSKQTDHRGFIFKMKYQRSEVDYLLGTYGI
ncbi:hypothetical protein HQN90_32965 [Paenibacillus alba]|nr:hypothetical protein [Paenibacillus alba]